MPAKSNDDLFGGSKEPLHPRLRHWKQLKDEYPLVDLEVRRKWDGLTYSPTKMFVKFRKKAKDPGVLEDVLWEDELNQGLVDLGVRAVDKDNEATRYGLALKSGLDRVSLRHGQDFVRSALVQDLRQRELGEDPALAAVLGQVHVHRASPGSSYDQAVDAIDGILRTKAQELESKLKYTRTETTDLLAKALAGCLDEMFHLRAGAFWGRGRAGESHLPTTRDDYRRASETPAKKKGHKPRRS